MKRLRRITELQFELGAVVLWAVWCGADLAWRNWPGAVFTAGMCSYRLWTLRRIYEEEKARVTTEAAQMGAQTQAWMTAVESRVFDQDD